MTRRWRTTAVVTVLLTLTIVLLPTAGIAASDAGAHQSAVAGAQQRSLPECGPERDGEVREYFGALWQCTYINGHWKWIAIGCSGCLAPRDTTAFSDDRTVARL